MSEYWKSTPKYHCKYCNTYVRDTPLEKTNHESSLKHQGNIKRYLRDLHRGHEREEREKQRARDEVARLNGVVSGVGAAAGGGVGGGGSSGSAPPPWQRKPAPPPTVQQQATPAERKAQMAKLAEMGVAIPEEFRGEMAMAGDWQVLSERVIGGGGEEGQEEDKKKLNIGVRKRKVDVDEDDEGEDGEGRTARKPWGSRIKTYPGAFEDEEDLDALLKQSTARKGKGRAGVSSEAQDGYEGGKEDTAETAIQDEERPAIKREDTESDTKVLAPAIEDSPDDPPVPVKTEEDLPLGGEVMFKKRKAKPIRQK